jgi:predicted RNase H-like HicB family nuclease
MAAYVAVIRKVPGTDYWVDIPDIPGCISRGATPDAAKANFREALAQAVFSCNVWIA